MAKSLVSFEAGDPIDDIVEALNRDGGVLMLNLAPPELMDEVYDEILANTSEHARDVSVEAISFPLIAIAATTGLFTMYSYKSPWSRKSS